MHTEFQTIEELVEFSLHEGPQTKGMYAFGRVSQELSGSILSVTGKSVYQYRVTIDNSAIRHIIRQHGGNIERLRGQVPVETSDFSALENNILAPQQVYNGGQRTGQPASVNFVVFTASLSITIVLDIHPGKRRQYLAVKTMYKRKGQPR